MDEVPTHSVVRLYRRFSPAGRAVLWLSIPFTLLDAIHYYTAGAAIVVSTPVLVLIYLLCGALAAHFAYQDQTEIERLPKTGRSAGLRLWLTSTVINTLISLVLGVVTLGGTLLSGAAYLCLFGPLHALGSFVVGGWGAWLYQRFLRRQQDV